MAVYNSEMEFVACSTTRQERIARLRQIIENLELMAIQSSLNSDVEEYQLDDGQVRIRTRYRNPEQISDAITKFERHLNKLINRCKGTRIIKLRDIRSFNTVQRYGGL